MRAIVDAERREHRVRGGAVDGKPGDALRDEQVLQRGERGQQMELLQHDAHVTAAEAVACRRRQRREILAVDLDDSFGRDQQPGDQVQQRGLAATRRSDDEHLLLGRHEQLVEGEHLGAASVSEVQPLDADHAWIRAARFAQPGQRPYSVTS